MIALSKLTVIGTVVEAYEDRGAKFLVLQTSDGKWKDHAVCRFYGDKAAPYAEKAQQGDLVMVEGNFRSVKAKDRWFSEFNARFLQVLQAAGTPAQRSFHEPEQGGDDSTDPF